MTQQALHFGPDVAPSDAKRLGRQLEAVRDLTIDGQWRTLDQIHSELKRRGVYASTPSISARLRQLRNELGYKVDKNKIGSGLNQYRVTPN